MSGIGTLNVSACEASNLGHASRAILAREQRARQEEFDDSHTISVFLHAGLFLHTGLSPPALANEETLSVYNGRRVASDAALLDVAVGMPAVDGISCGAASLPWF